MVLREASESKMLGIVCSRSSSVTLLNQREVEISLTRTTLLDDNKGAQEPLDDQHFSAFEFFLIPENSVDEYLAAKTQLTDILN
jgi:hypothetical protein